MDRKVHQVGGILLLLAGIAGTLGGVFELTQPAVLATISEWAAQWRLSEIAIGVSGMLLLASTIFLGRHFAGAQGEGWALVGTVALFLGGIALLGSAAWATRDFSGLLVSTQGGGYPVDPVFGAASTSMSYMATVAVWVLPVAVALYGLCMRTDSRWPRWFAWIGVVMGVGSLGLLSPWISLVAASPVPFILPHVWLAGTGILLRKSSLLAFGTEVLDAQSTPGAPRTGSESSWQPEGGSVPQPRRAFDEATGYAEATGAMNGDRESGGRDMNAETGAGLAASGVSSMAANEHGERTSEGALAVQAVPPSPVLFEYVTEEEARSSFRQRSASEGGYAQGMTSVRSGAFREWLRGPR